MKVIILTPVWGRPDITQIWAMGLICFIPKDWRVLCILSAEDEQFNDNLKICQDSGFDFCIYENNPLGKKLNAGVEYALSYEWDYLMNLGSDDLVHPGLLQVYLPFFEKKMPFFGINRVFFYEKKTGKLAKSVPYVWGAGRVIRRDLIEKLKNMGDFLYDSREWRGLDCNSMDRIQLKLNTKYEVLDVDFPYLVDIKTDDSLNHFAMQGKFCSEVPVEMFTDFYPKVITDML